VLDRLQDEATRENWNIDKQKAGEGAFVTCPEGIWSYFRDWPNNPMTRRTGYYVIEALKEFLEYPELVSHTDGAFAVDLRDGSVQPVPYSEALFEQGSQPIEWSAYQVQPEMQEKSWRFALYKDIVVELPVQNSPPQ
jgi:hypothetical protein